jgi:hypothetical protein
VICPLPSEGWGRGRFRVWKEALGMILKPTPQERAMKAKDGDLSPVDAALA